MTIIGIIVGCLTIVAITYFVKWFQAWRVQRWCRQQERRWESQPGYRPWEGAK